MKFFPVAIRSHEKVITGERDRKIDMTELSISPFRSDGVSLATVLPLGAVVTAHDYANAQAEPPRQTNDES